MLIGASSIAHADPAARIDAGAFLGGNYFSAENELGNAYFREQTPESAFLIGLRGSYSLLRPAAGSSLAPRLSLELEGKLALSSTGSATDRMRSSYFAPVVGWRAQAILDLWSEYRAHPFAVLGVGGETIFSSSPFVASGDSDAAMYWGVGAKYALAPRYGLRGDVRHGITAGRFDTASSTVEAHVGFYYAFSLGKREEPVAEIEVAEAEVTQEPIEPEDRDEDGIPDADDVCPTEAELVNEIEDEDGCPELDADEDGLVGELDQCPAEPEDREGFEDEDGCPDPDNDQDSHADASDECPQEAETDNGFEDEDGCPDEVPARVAEYIGVIEGIRFGNASARIQGARSRQILDQAAAILLEYPSVHIRISGHTDARGSHARNMAISRERADAVKWYLVDRGIEHTRLVTMGYGPEQPIADNDTPEGRARNRRIEFELLTNPIVEGAPAKQDEAAPEQAPAPAEQDASAPAEATERAPE
jgi:OOP family OmpA-OmpF porin